ncbi:transcriptional regulator, partial [Deinococcus sp. 6YEL10]|nr:transcriptional regulator [Deinococcus sp. 6YEL10]
TTPSGLPALQAALHVAARVWGEAAAAQAAEQIGYRPL